MPLYVALLLSFTLHASLVIAPNWLTAKNQSEPPSLIEARLMPIRMPVSDAVTSEPVAAGNDAATPPPAVQPGKLQGRSLHRAQTALSKHLFYPPEAVALGIEGEVILLLTLTESGQLAKAEIARSSGHALLDQAALAAARQIGTLPGNGRQTLFPVSFQLR